MVRLVLSLSVLAFSAPVLADEGETSVDLRLSPEVSFLVHPSVGKATTLPFDGAFALKPRLGASVRHGITNWLSLGVGLDGAGTLGLTTKEVVVSDTKGDLLTAAYGELALPLSLGFRFDSGYDLSGGAELELGPMLAYWGGSALVDPNDLNDEGLPAPFPVDIQTGFHPGLFARLTLLFQARLFDIFLFDIGPSCTLSWATMPSISFGLLLRPSLVLGVLPL
jgi:hypothetical protein